MTPRSARAPDRRLGALLAVLLATAIVGPGAAEASPPAAKPRSSVPPPPKCLGKPPTIVGSGSVHGTAHADVIVAGVAADQIVGGGGNDRICAGGGDDTIEGGTGSDRIEAGLGDDEVSGGNGSDLVLGGLGTDTVFGNRGNDHLLGEAGTDFLASGLGDDTLDGGPGDGDQVVGGVGTDRLAGGEGDGDVLEGDFGVDTLDGGAGAHDTVSYALSGEASVFYGGLGVEVDLGAGTAYGDGEDSLVGIEDVVGTPFADKIVGDAEPNEIYGGAGMDELTGAGAGDIAFGGSGSDHCREVASSESCENKPPPNFEGITEAELFQMREEAIGHPTFEVELPGGPVTGSITGIVEHGLAAVVKQEMQVHVSFSESAWVVVEQGLPMAAGEGCVLLTAETARCPITTTPTGLFLDGGEGADLLAVDPSVPATVSARMVGGIGVDTLIGGAGDDDLDPTRSPFGGDAAYGGPGDDALSDGSLLDGQSGSDLLIARPCGETVVGGAGVDSVSFARVERGVEAALGGIAAYAPGLNCGSASTQIDGSVESIEGSAYDDILTGDAGSNRILGRGGDDVIHGVDGDDFLVGGEGVDSLFGEGGADRLYARDGRRDLAIDCGPTTPGDVAVVDPGDPKARRCIVTGAGTRAR